MLAMVLEKPGVPLVAAELPVPEPGSGQIRIKIRACGVCRTDLHLVDGELPNPKLPIIPGHEIVGIVDKLGDGDELLELAPRVPIKTHCETYPLTRANDALADLRSGKLTGAAVLVMP